MFTRRSLAAMSAALVAPFALRAPAVESEPMQGQELTPIVLGPPLKMTFDLVVDGVDAGPVLLGARRVHSTGMWMFAGDPRLLAALDQVEAAEIARREAAGEPALIVI